MTQKFCSLLLFYLDAFGHPISLFSGFYSSTCSEVCSNTPSVCLMCKPIYLFLCIMCANVLQGPTVQVVTVVDL